MFGLALVPPDTSACRMARGPNRAPGRYDVASSTGAPTMATSTPASSPGSRARGSLQNVVAPAYPGSPWRPTIRPAISLAPLDAPTRRADSPGRPCRSSTLGFGPLCRDDLVSPPCKQLRQDAGVVRRGGQGIVVEEGPGLRHREARDPVGPRPQLRPGVRGVNGPALVEPDVRPAAREIGR